MGSFATFLGQTKFDEIAEFVRIGFIGREFGRWIVTNSLTKFKELKFASGLRSKRNAPR